MTDRLDRFVSAQADSWDTALAELRAGAKRSHWMWFIFPQITGLGRSPTAHYYAIADVAEARAYFAHAALGPRLIAASEAMLAHRDRAAATILGEVDAQKLRSSMTLFEAAGGDAVFGRVLDAFYGGERDAATLTQLSLLAA